MKRILVTGATGQIGSELVPVLRDKYGSDNVVAAGHRRKPEDEFIDSGPYATIETTDAESISALVKKYRIELPATCIVSLKGIAVFVNPVTSSFKVPDTSSPE